MMFQVKFKKPTNWLAAIVLAAGFSAADSAQAATCQFGIEEDFTASADVWTSTDCVGALAGNDAIGNDSGSNVDLNNPANFSDGPLFGSTEWELNTKINRDGSNFALANPDGILSATLYDDLLSGTWSVTSWDGIQQAVLVLKGGSGFAAYLLDLSAGTFGKWSTQALTVGQQDNQPALSHVSLYTSPAPIPLPAAGWLLLSAIGGLGIAARRRRKSS